MITKTAEDWKRYWRDRPEEATWADFLLEVRLETAEVVRAACVPLACRLCARGIAHMNPGEERLYHRAEGQIVTCDATAIINAELLEETT